MTGRVTSRARRWAGSVAVLAALAVSSAVATRAAFVDTTASTANSFAAGTVDVGDNDADGAVLSLANAAPGATDTGCLRVTYTGTLDAGLRLYGTISGSLAPYLTLTVTRGTDTSPSFRSCAGFTADTADYLGSGAGVVYSGALSGFPATFAAGVVDPPSGPVETWTTGEARSYRFAITLGSDPGAAGLSATAAFTWEARNQ